VGQPIYLVVLPEHFREGSVAVYQTLQLLADCWTLLGATVPNSRRLRL
jgi:hypothetical protein